MIPSDLSSHRAAPFNLIPSDVAGSPPSPSASSNTTTLPANQSINSEAEIMHGVQLLRMTTEPQPSTSQPIHSHSEVMPKIQQCAHATEEIEPRSQIIDISQNFTVRADKAARLYAKKNDPLSLKTAPPAAHEKLSSYPIIPPAQVLLPQAPPPTVDKKDIFDILEAYLNFIKKGNTQGVNSQIEKIKRLNDSEVVNHFREMHLQMLKNRSEMNAIEEAAEPLQNEYLATQDDNLRSRLINKMENENGKIKRLNEKNAELVSQFKSWLIQYEPLSSSSPRQSIILERDTHEEVPSPHSPEVSPIPRSLPIISKKEAKRQKALWNKANEAIGHYSKRYENAVNELSSISMAMKVRDDSNFQGLIEKHKAIAENTFNSIKLVIGSLQNNQGSGRLITNTQTIIQEIDSIHKQILLDLAQGSLYKNSTNLLLKLFRALYKLPE